MAYKWKSHPWLNNWKSTKRDAGQELQADRLLHTVTTQRNEPSVEGLVEYADSAYLSSRILMLSSYAVHLEALFCVAQTIEKYMKALLLQAVGPSRYKKLKLNTKHDLVELAQAVTSHTAFSEFGDSDFRRVCEMVTPLETAGRYPDHILSLRPGERAAWDLELLTFLDEYVVHCRSLLQVSSNTRNWVDFLCSVLPNDNPVMKSARRAVRENNHQIRELRNWPLRGG